MNQLSNISLFLLKRVFNNGVLITLHHTKQSTLFSSIIFKTMAISSSETETQIPLVKASNSVQLEVELVKCDSCGFTEECTLAYITRIREKYNGRWICGLCVEAVKDEVLRSDRMITTEEALNRHISFCQNFQSSSSTASEHPIFAMGRVLRRSWILQEV